MKWSVLLLFLLLALPSYGQGKSPNGPPGPIGNPNNQGNQGANQGNEGRANAPIPGQRIQLAPGQDPKALVPSSAQNAAQLGFQTELSFSNLSVVRNVLVSSFSHDGTEVGFWAAGHGDFVKEEGEAKVATGGIVFAVDKRFSSHLVLGIAGGYSYSSSSEIDSSSGWGGGYFTLFGRGFYLNQILIGGGNTFSTSRAGLLGTAKANSAGWFFSSVSEAGWQAKWRNLTLGPYALFQYSLAGNGSFSESGSDVPLDVHSGSQDSIISDLGAEASYAFGRLTARGSLSWEHEYADTTTLSKVNIIGIPSSLTTVSGTSLGHDSLIINAGLSYKLTKSISVGVGYIGQVGRKNEQSNSITANIRIGF